MTAMAALGTEPPSEALLFRFFLDNRPHRALIHARAAIRAQFSIDDVLVALLMNRFLWTFTRTCTAGDAVIRNYMSHYFLLLIFDCPSADRPAPLMSGAVMRA